MTSPALLQRPHYHGAAELVIGYQNEVLCKLDEGPSITNSTILISPGVRHANDYQDELSVTIYFDSDSAYFQRLSNDMVQVTSALTSMTDIRNAQESVRWIYENEPRMDICREKLKSILLGGSELSVSKIDVRIQIVLDQLRQNPANN